MSKNSQQREQKRGKCTAPKAVAHRAPHAWLCETPYWSRARKREEYIKTHESTRGTSGVKGAHGSQKCIIA